MTNGNRVTLARCHAEQIVTRLENHYGWDGLAQRIDINCFKHEQSIVIPVPAQDAVGAGQG